MENILSSLLTHEILITETEEKVFCSGKEHYDTW